MTKLNFKQLEKRLLEVERAAVPAEGAEFAGIPYNQLTEEQKQRYIDYRYGVNSISLEEYEELEKLINGVDVLKYPCSKRCRSPNKKELEELRKEIKLFLEEMEECKK